MQKAIITLLGLSYYKNTKTHLELLFHAMIIHLDLKLNCFCLVLLCSNFVQCVLVSCDVFGIFLSPFSLI